MRSTSVAAADLLVAAMQPDNGIRSSRKSASDVKNDCQGQGLSARARFMIAHSTYCDTACSVGYFELAKSRMLHIREVNTGCGES